MNKLSYLLILAVFFSCKKELPPVGEYIGNFYGKNGWGDCNEENILIEFTGGNDSQLFFNTSNYNNIPPNTYFLTKKDDSLFGKIFPKEIGAWKNGCVSLPEIKGVWERKLFADRIIGTFSGSGSSSNPQSNIHGTFELKKK